MKQWQDAAACRDEDLDLFFPNTAASEAFDKGRLLCDACPVSNSCRLSALGEIEGLFALTTPEQRRVFRVFWGVSDMTGELGGEGQRVARIAFERGVDPRQAARDWLGDAVGDAWMDWYAVTLPADKYRYWMAYLNVS